jgi:hypothetical protein
MTNSLYRLGLMALSLVAGWAAGGMAAVPEIANVFPDPPGFGPHIITGESFDPGSTEVWIWEPSPREAAEKEMADRPGSDLPEPRAQPPRQ